MHLKRSGLCRMLLSFSDLLSRLLSELRPLLSSAFPFITDFCYYETLWVLVVKSQTSSLRVSVKLQLLETWEKVRWTCCAMKKRTRAIKRKPTGENEHTLNWSWQHCPDLLFFHPHPSSSSSSSLALSPSLPASALVSPSLPVFQPLSFLTCSFLSFLMEQEKRRKEEGEEICFPTKPQSENGIVGEVFL